MLMDLTSQQKYFADPKSIFEMPELMTALQEFSDEVEYFEEAELRRNHDQDEVLASAKSVDVEDYSKQVKTCIFVIFFKFLETA